MTSSSVPDGNAPLFETDFEGDTTGEMPDTTVWTNNLPTTYDSMGIVRVDATKAHSGTKSVYVRKNTEGHSALQMEDGGIFPVTSGPIYVRAWLLVPSWPDSHVSWMEVGAKADESSEIRVGAHLGVLQVNQYPPDSDQRADGVLFAPNEWHCIEYRYEPAPAGASGLALEVWLDDAAVSALTITDGKFSGTAFSPAPSIDVVRLGVAINAEEVWFDDIAISKQAIGCQ